MDRQYENLLGDDSFYHNTSESECADSGRALECKCRLLSCFRNFNNTLHLLFYFFSINILINSLHLSQIF